MAAEWNTLLFHIGAPQDICTNKVQLKIILVQVGAPN